MSGKAKVWSFGLGVTTSNLSATVSQTYYVQINGENAFNNNKTTFLNAINLKFAFLGLLFKLL